MSKFNTRKSNRNTTRNEYKTFNPMVFVLERIRTYFDEKAYIHRETGKIVYYIETGDRLALGSPRNAHLVYRRKQCFLGMPECRAICRDLGMLP